MRKILVMVGVIRLVALVAFAAEPTPLPAVVKDSFPAGGDTPEGAACDLARAFIHDDPALFLATCIEPFGDAESKAAYHKFLENIVVQMKMDVAGSPPSPESPQRIARCFAARHLSKSGPASYGYAAFGFQDVMFVDVDALLRNGTTQLCRALVIKNKQGRWQVHPQPELCPLLSAGLDDEPPSTAEYIAAKPTP